MKNCTFIKITLIFRKEKRRFQLTVTHFSERNIAFRFLIALWKLFHNCSNKLQLLVKSWVVAAMQVHLSAVATTGRLMTPSVVWIATVQVVNYHSVHVNNTFRLKNELNSRISFSKQFFFRFYDKTKFTGTKRYKKVDVRWQLRKIEISLIITTIVFT